MNGKWVGSYDGFAIHSATFSQVEIKLRFLGLWVRNISEIRLNGQNQHDPDSDATNRQYSADRRGFFILSSHAGCLSSCDKLRVVL
jgi:hypothetical protein